MVEPLVLETLQEKAYQAIRRSIVQNKLLPGQDLAIDCLARSLGISATPVREALGRLAADGLVKCRPHRKACVADLSDADVRQVYEVRSLLEPYVAGRVACRVGSDATLNEAICELVCEAERASRVAEYPSCDVSVLRDEIVGMDLKLQDVLVAALDSTILARSLRFVGDHSLRIRSFVEAVTETASLATLSCISKEHLHILKALSEGDANRANAATLSHLRSAEQRTLVSLANWRLEHSREECSPDADEVAPSSGTQRPNPAGQVMSSEEVDRDQ